MKTYIILLRGVMPTGKNKVPIAELRAALDKAGLENVRTYTQSGNVVAESNLNQSRIEKLVHDVINKNFGGDIVVLARTAARLRSILARNPFKKADTTKLYFTLLAAKPKVSRIREFAALGHALDKVKMIGDTVYVLCATRYSDLKANNNFIERKLGVAATTRVYNTVAELNELSADR